MQSSSIHVQHLDAKYTVGRGQDSASAVRRRLDRIASNLLTRDLDNRFASLSASNGALYFIEHMTMDLMLDISRDDETLARTWARGLQESIVRVLNRGGSGVIVFRDRAEYVARFLADLIRGRAWEVWYYREFENLRSLSSGQAVLQVLTDDGETGRDALVELARRGDLDLLLATLTDAEVETVVTRCLLPSGPSIVLPAMYGPWVRALRSLIRGFVWSSVLSRDLARLYLSVLREWPELGPDANLARFIREVLRLRQAVTQSSDCSVFFAMVESENWAGALCQLKRGSEQRLLATLVREIAGPEVVALMRELQPGPPSAIPELVSTQYGGIFLLVPTILEMELIDFLKRCPYPEPRGMSKGGLLLFVIALQSLGRKNAEQAQHDKGLALFAGLSTPPTLSQFQRYAEGLNPEKHGAFDRMFRAQLSEVVNRPGVSMPAPGTSTEPMDNSGWLSLCSGAEPILPDREWDLTLSAVSSVVLRQFASKLGAFAESSFPYICRNFLESHAEIEVFAERISVRFLTCPLQMVLRMAGFDHQTWTIPWLANRKLEFHYE